MSNVETKTTIENDVKQSTQKKDDLRTISVSITKDQTAVVLNSDTMEIVSKMFTSQDDIANETKYTRTFIHSAVIAGAKQECRRLANVWENAITKENKLHPAWSREQAEQELLQSKKMQELKAQVDVAVSLLKTEFK